MKFNNTFLAAALLSLVCGCATTETSTTTKATTAPAVSTPSRYVSDDRRTIEIGKAYSSNGGKAYKNPHLDSCWIADGFNFSGYDTLYIAPTKSTAKYQNDEQTPHDTAKQNVVTELANLMATKGLFKNVVTQESDIKGNARVLRMENTIVEYAKDGGGARYWAGLYGAGQPTIRVQGKVTEGDKTVFTYDGRRSGVSAGARMFGAFKTDIDIQREDIRSLATDLSDFVAAVGGKYQAK